MPVQEIVVVMCGGLSPGHEGTKNIVAIKILLKALYLQYLTELKCVFVFVCTFFAGVVYILHSILILFSRGDVGTSESIVPGRNKMGWSWPYITLSHNNQIEFTLLKSSQNQMNFMGHIKQSMQSNHPQHQHVTPPQPLSLQANFQRCDSSTELSVH